MAGAGVGSIMEGVVLSMGASFGFEAVDLSTEVGDSMFLASIRPITCEAREFLQVPFVWHEIKEAFVSEVGHGQEAWYKWSDDGEGVSLRPYAGGAKAGRACWSLCEGSEGASLGSRIGEVYSILRPGTLSNAWGSSREMDKAKRNADLFVHTVEQVHIFDSHPTTLHLHNTVLHSNSCLLPNDNIHQAADLDSSAYSVAMLSAL
ncbi:hypothetical protein F8388_019202 [Cannabis sativa]|uniref:Uncharacterized protein n=1 Tax=Cannabis sativa TaxID=3483 RepID=A0A7J6F5T7_CANSA|nr:hypothetical protein F8388_019202 [Cannabis sativa]